MRLRCIRSKLGSESVDRYSGLCYNADYRLFLIVERAWSTCLSQRRQAHHARFILTGNPHNKFSSSNRPMIGSIRRFLRRRFLFLCVSPRQYTWEREVIGVVSILSREEVLALQICVRTVRLGISCRDSVCFAAQYRRP